MEQISHHKSLKSPGGCRGGLQLMQTGQLDKSVQINSLMGLMFVLQTSDL